MRLILIFIFCTLFFNAQDSKNIKTIHVFVALCDNVNQGIVPVSKTLGNGQDPKNNLYWGALYGVKTYFKQSKDWTYLKTLQSENSQILQRVLFKHKTTNTYLLADAYNGKHIKKTTIDFLKSSSGAAHEQKINYENEELCFGGSSNLLAYVGHDGLMEFSLNEDFESKNNEKRDAIILACISKDYFAPYLKETGTMPWFGQRG